MRVSNFNSWGQVAAPIQKILVIGDLHGIFKLFNKLIAEETPDIVLQCGDFAYFWPGRKSRGIIKTNGTRVYWCPGNHEDWATIIGNYPPGGIYEVEENIFLCTFGAVLELPDKRTVMFCGGGLSTDWRARIPGEDWWAEETITGCDLKALPDPREVGVDIVVSHTKPRSFQFANYRNEAKEKDESCRLLDERVLKEFQPLHWYFGHFHRHETGEFKGTNWTALHQADMRRGALGFAGHKGWWTELAS